MTVILSFQNSRGVELPVASKTRKSNESFKKALPFLLPSLIGLAVFNFVPIITSLAISLTKWDGLSELTLFSNPSAFFSAYFTGVSNYASMLTSSDFYRVLGNTLYFIVLYIPLMIIVSLLAASVLNSKIKGIGIYRVLYYIPVLTSWVAGALIWKWLLSPQYGPINSIIAVFGLQGPTWLQSEVWAMPGIVLASIWKDMGYFSLIFLGGLQGIDTTYYEAADIDGASWWQKFTKITIPMLSPVTFFVMIISIINSFQLFPQIMVMTLTNGVVGGPNGATQVMVERIYNYAFKYHEMGIASAYSWVLFIIIFIFTAVQMKLQNRWVHYDG